MRRGILSVIAFAVLLVLTWMVSSSFPAFGTNLSSAGFMVAVMSMLLKWLFLFATILSIVSALGSNRCKSCGYKWR